jgi:hypothetical protein
MQRLVMTRRPSALKLWAYVSMATSPNWTMRLLVISRE